MAILLTCTWMARTPYISCLPKGLHPQLIGDSQGRLFYVKRAYRNTYSSSIYLLYEHWWFVCTLKHRINTSRLFVEEEYYMGVAAIIHPHCNSVFLFDSLQGRLMLYNMDNQSGRVIRRVEPANLWSFVPYVPLYLETSALANHN